jgi:hypothetical protein
MVLDFSQTSANLQKYRVTIFHYYNTCWRPQSNAEEIEEALEEIAGDQGDQVID